MYKGIYFLLPIISALIGWSTNYLAVRMIFRPRREIRIGKIKIHGLIPKRRHEIALKIAETIEKELISYEDIKNIVESNEFQSHTEELIRKRIEEIIERKVGLNSFVKFFIGEDIKNKLIDNIMLELRDEIGGLINSLFEKIEERVNFRDIVKERIDSFDLVKLENIIYSIASRELKTIELLGGVLGFIVGVIQLGLVIITESF